jgi:hypothetical protein
LKPGSSVPARPETTTATSIATPNAPARTSTARDVTTRLTASGSGTPGVVLEARALPERSQKEERHGQHDARRPREQPDGHRQIRASGEPVAHGRVREQRTEDDHQKQCRPSRPVDA